jgi:hypothetical protein
MNKFVIWKTLSNEWVIGDNLSTSAISFLTYIYDTMPLEVKGVKERGKEILTKLSSVK